MRELKEIQKDIEEIIKINDENIAENNKKELMKKNLEEKNKELTEELGISNLDDVEELLKKETEELESLIAEAKKAQGEPEQKDDEVLDGWGD